MHKRLFTLMAALFALGLTACGGTVCDEAGDITTSAVEEYCAENADCAACTCINDPDDASCPEPTEGEEVACEGAAQDAAQTCVDDEAACRSAATAGLEMACGT